MTTLGQVEYTVSRSIKHDICDDCALVAYDEGIQNWDEQVTFMVNVGDMANDHVCARREYPSDDFSCDCGCN
jgi:hypothetical protein